MNKWPKPGPTKNGRSCGFTLTDLLLSVVVGLIVIAAASSILLSARQAFRSNDAVARIQENRRRAFDELARDIRQAGYYGCAGQEGYFHSTLRSPDNLLWDFSAPVSGYEATSDHDWNIAPDPIISNPLGGRDILVIRSLDNGAGTILSQRSPVAALTVSGKSGIRVGDILLASNCRITNIFQATAVVTENGHDLIEHASGVSPTPGNLTNELSSTFDNGELQRISTKIYYIARAPSGVPSLYVRRSADPVAHALIVGINNLQITYGIDDNGDYSAERYVDASTAQKEALWNSVVSVRITLTAIAPPDVVTQSQNATPNVASGKRLLPDITTTITLRNRAG